MIDAVRWVTLGAAEMAAARARLGYSHERVARELDVSLSTWMRWSARGRVPAGRVPDVAALLRLEVEDQAPRRVDPAHEELRQVIREELDARIGSIDSLLAEIARRLANDAHPQDQS